MGRLVEGAAIMNVNGRSYQLKVAIQYFFSQVGLLYMSLTMQTCED